MAKLLLPYGYFELKPIARQPAQSKYLELYLCLEMNIQSQRLLIENKRKIYMTEEDFSRFSDGTRLFVENCANKLNFDIPNKPFDFTPMELSFIFSCLEGDIDEEMREGEITIRIMGNVSELTQTSLPTTYIGGLYNVKVVDLLNFLKILEGEVLDLQF